MQPKIIVFKGSKYRLSGNYYRRHVWGKGGPSNLHRAIWEDNYGEIPEDYHIHHVDGNTFNNELSNLECLPRSKHLSDHTKELIRTGVLKPPSELARIKSAEWHASKEGLEWHSAHGKKTWEGRSLSSVVCEVCNLSFDTPFPTRSRYCSDDCRSRSRALGLRRHRLKDTHETRPKPRQQRPGICQ